MRRKWCSFMNESQWIELLKLWVWYVVNFRDSDLSTELKRLQECDVFHNVRFAETKCNVINYETFEITGQRRDYSRLFRRWGILVNERIPPKLAGQVDRLWRGKGKNATLTRAIRAMIANLAGIQGPSGVVVRHRGRGDFFIHREGAPLVQRRLSDVINIRFWNI